MLFVEHPVRKIMAAVVAVGASHIIFKFLPDSMHAFQFTQTTVSVLAIGCLCGFIMLHHRSDGRFMTQTQEEMVIIGALGVFWFGILVAMRVWKKDSVNVNLDHPRHMLSANSGNAESAVVGAGSRNREGGQAAEPRAGVASRGNAYDRYEKPTRCRGDYCVYEEWTYYDNNNRRW